MTAPPEDRILDATLVCLARYGVAKTTLDDVAREAGCARATVYRYFSGKQQLLLAAIEREGLRVLVAVDREAADATTLEDALIAMATTAARMLTDHGALQFVLAHEPEAILPAVTFEGGDRFLADAALALAPTFARFLPPARAERAAEWCTRVFLAYLGADDAPICMTDPDQVRDLVRDFVAPGLSVTVSQATVSQSSRG
ncbi:MAG: TetR/AcrR family transcriptional regulator [Acidimicrobiia bacterium]